MFRRYCFFLLLLAVSISAGQAQPLDTLEHRTVAPGVTYTKYFQPGPYVLDVMEIDITNEYIDIQSFRADGLTRTSVQAAQNDREGHRVIGAINADFFSFETGWPINNQVQNGKFVLGRPAVRSHFGMDVEKRPYIEQFSFTGSVHTGGGGGHTIDGVNIERGSGQLIFYTSFRGSTTGTPGQDVTVQLVGDQWHVGDTLRYVVTGSSSAGSSPIPDGGGVLSGSGTGATFLEQQVQVGDTLSIYLGFNPDVRNLTQVIAGGGRILENGENVSHLNPEREQIGTTFMLARHPRTFVGISEDSTKVFFCTVDGRQAASLGMSFNEMASFLQRIGVWHAFNLDGGGSTTMVVRGEVANSPSDPGGERSVANTLHAVSIAPTGTLSFLHIAPERMEVFQGREFQFSASGTDEFYNPIPLPQDVIWEADPHIGEITDAGLFRAESVNDSGWVRVRWNDVVDSARVIVRVVEELRVYPRILDMVPGERLTLQVIGFDSEGTRSTLRNTQVQYSLSDVGLNISSAGVVTATDFGDGFLTVSLDTVTVEVPYTTHGAVAVHMAEDFEGLLDWHTELDAPVDYDPENVEVAMSDEHAYSGDQSLRISYALPGGDGRLRLLTRQQLSSRVDTVYVHLYGDGLPHKLELLVADKDGDLFWMEGNPSGAWQDEWRRIAFVVPDARAVGPGVLDFPIMIREIRVHLGAGETTDAPSGTIFLDALQAHYPLRGVAPDVLWDFESGIAGWFTPQQTHHAQIHGVDVVQSSLMWTSERAYKGNYSGRWTYVDDPNLNVDWSIRITRAANQDLGNILRGAFVGAWVYAEGQTDLEMRIVIRGGDGQLKQGPPLQMNHVGWKLIGAKLEEEQFDGYIHEMTPFTPSGNQFNGFVVTGPNSKLQGETRVFYIDELVTSALTVPTGFHEVDVVHTPPNVRITWSVNSEMSVNRYAVERSTGEDFMEIGAVNAVGNTDTTQTYEFVDVVTDPVSETYTYRVRQVTNDGAQEISDAYTIPFEVSAGEHNELAKSFRLDQNYPNPFNPTTIIRYDVPFAADVVLNVWNVLGQRVATLVDRSHEPGSFQTPFDASAFASGVYFYRMEARAPGSNALLFTQTRKLILTK